MPYRDLEPISKQVTIVIGLTVVGFMAFGLALSFYRNILFEQHLGEIGKRNDELGSELRKGEEDLAYFRSTQYKDKYAKENLGRLNPGEKILILTDEAPVLESPSSPGEDFTEEEQAAYEETLRQLPVILHWKLFLFEREKLEGLKEGV